MLLRLCLFLLASVQLALGLEDGVSLVVAAGKIDCFYRDVQQKETTMDFDVQVLSGQDVSYQVRGPTGRVYQKESYIQSMNKHLALEEIGVYEICFDNSYSMVSDKVVYFDLGIHEPNDDRFANVRHDDTDKETATELIKAMESLSRRLETVSLFQSVLKAKKTRHLLLVGDSGTKVMVFSIICSLLMMGVGTLQVFVVRRLFSEKKGSRT